MRQLIPLALVVLSAACHESNVAGGPTPVGQTPAPTSGSACASVVEFSIGEHDKNMAPPHLKITASVPVAVVEVLENGQPYTNRLEFEGHFNSHYRVRASTPACASFSEWAEFKIGDPNPDNSGRVSGPVPPQGWHEWSGKTGFVFANNGDGLEFSFHPTFPVPVQQCQLWVTAKDHNHPQAGNEGSVERLDVSYAGSYVGTTPDIADNDVSATGGPWALSFVPNTKLTLRRAGNSGSIHGAEASMRCQ